MIATLRRLLHVVGSVVGFGYKKDRHAATAGTTQHDGQSEDSNALTRITETSPGVYHNGCSNPLAAGHRGQAKKLQCDVVLGSNVLEALIDALGEARAERDAAIAELHELASKVVDAIEEYIYDDEDGSDSEFGDVYRAAFHILHRDDPPEVQ